MAWGGRVASFWAGGWLAGEEAGGGHQVGGRRLARRQESGQRRSGGSPPPVVESMDSGAERDRKEGRRATERDVEECRRAAEKKEQGEGAAVGGEVGRRSEVAVASPCRLLVTAHRRGPRRLLDLLGMRAPPGPSTPRRPTPSAGLQEVAAPHAGTQLSIASQFTLMFTEGSDHRYAESSIICMVYITILACSINLRCEAVLLAGVWSLWEKLGDGSGKINMAIVLFTVRFLHECYNYLKESESCPTLYHFTQERECISSNCQAAGLTSVYLYEPARTFHPAILKTKEFYKDWTIILALGVLFSAWCSSWVRKICIPVVDV